MGKIIPRSACSFVPSDGLSAGLNYGPQALNNEPWQSINLGVGGAPCAVQLAEPGTYLVHGRIHFGGNFQAGDMVYFGLFDAEQELELGDTGGIKVPLADWEWEQEFTRIHTTTTGPRTIYLYATNNSANRGGVIGIRTRIQWVRLK
ncbi:MAG: hypothetical protein H0X66_20970 [Verrucomicrobia bacterium]|nr:hypothetical protein [Verrucomicrobiota bacterium]